MLFDLPEMDGKWWTGVYDYATLSMDEKEFRQFYQEIVKRTKNMDEYGESNSPVVEDAFIIRDGHGKEYLYRVSLDGYLHGVVIAKIDMAKYKSCIKRYGRSKNYGRAPANTIRRVGGARAKLGRNGSGSSGHKSSNGNIGSSGVVSASPSSSNGSNYSQGKSTYQKVSSTTDSDGKQLTTGQREYFAESAVRDENGNLVVMYHGTSRGGFTIFDVYGSNYGLFGGGSYFTSSRSVAQNYTKKGKGDNPQIYAVYLNIKKPMDMDAQADPGGEGAQNEEKRGFLEKLKAFLTGLFDRLCKAFAGERNENRAVAAFRVLDKSVQDMLVEKKIRHLV